MTVDDWMAGELGLWTLQEIPETVEEFLGLTGGSGPHWIEVAVSGRRWFRERELGRGRLELSRRPAKSESCTYHVEVQFARSGLIRTAETRASCAYDWARVPYFEAGWPGYPVFAGQSLMVELEVVWH